MADHDSRTADPDASTLERFVNEVIEHSRGDVEVGDDAVAQWSGGDDVGWGAADHGLGLLADREDGVVDPVDRDGLMAR